MGFYTSSSTDGATFEPRCFDKICFILYMYILFLKYLQTRTADTQWRHTSKKYENLGRCGRQNMLRPYLKIWEWEWISGPAVKAICSPVVRSPWTISLLKQFVKVQDSYWLLDSGSKKKKNETLLFSGSEHEFRISIYEFLNQSKVIFSVFSGLWTLIYS